MAGEEESARAPLVSVIIPVHGPIPLLRSTLDSVLAQSLTDWELWLVDDGVSAQDRETLMAWADQDHRITLLATGGNPQMGRGAGPARNMGIAAARGRYVAFLDADDLWHPAKLAMQVASMQGQGAVLSCTAYLRQDLDSGKRTLIGVPVALTRRMLLGTNYIACSSAMYDRAHFGLQQMPDLRRRQDFAFWLQLLAITDRAIGLPQVLMTYRQTRQSLSGSKTTAARDTWAMYRHSLGMPLPAAMLAFGKYALHGLARHRAPRLARLLGWLHDAQEP